EPCSVSQLRKNLLLSNLRPGDVILTRPSGFATESKMITVAVGGPFSHAALVIAPTVWFESDDHGIGVTYVRVDAYHRTADSQVAKWLKDVSDYAQIGVFRNPALERIPSRSISRAIRQIGESLEGKR